MRRLCCRCRGAIHLRIALYMAGVASAFAAIIAAYDGVWQFSLCLAVPTAVLFLGLAKAWPRVQLLAQLALIIELLILGGIWPSVITLVALLALPSVVRDHLSDQASIASMGKNLHCGIYVARFGLPAL